MFPVEKKKECFSTNERHAVEYKLADMEARQQRAG